MAIRITNLSSAEDITPYDAGEYYSYANRWINYGKKNDYPIYLRNLFLKSPTHAACVKGTVQLAAGEGVYIQNPEQNPFANKFLNENFSLDTIKNLLFDLKLYGYCTALIYDGKIVKYEESINFRMGSKDDQGNLKTVWYCDNWDQHNNKKYRPVELPIYYEGSTEPVSVLIETIHKAGLKYYAPVDYSSCIVSIETECAIQRFHLANIHNGLTPTFLISYPGTSSFDQEQMDSIEYYVNKKFGGVDNAGKAIMDFCDTPETAAKITTIDIPKASEQYKHLQTTAQENILLAHGANPILFGIHSDGTGWSNNADEIQTAYVMFYNDTLSNLQEIILKFIIKIMEGNMLYTKPKFITYNPFANLNKDKVQLSAQSEDNEISINNKINALGDVLTKAEGKLLNEKVFDGILKENRLYKFIKSSNKNNLFIKKMELMDKKGYLFKPNDIIIKNCQDYYFMELTYIKIND